MTEAISLSDITNSAYQCDILLHRIYDIPVKIKDDFTFLKAVTWLETLRDQLQAQVMKHTNDISAHKEINV